MSGKSSGMLAIALVLWVIGGLITAFPDNSFLQTRNLGGRFGNVKDNTKSFGIIIIIFGLMFFGMWLVLVL